MPNAISDPFTSLSLAPNEKILVPGHPTDHWCNISRTIGDSRPGATEVSAEEEMSRVVPIIEGIRAATGATGTGSTGAEEEGGDNAPVGRVAVTISVDTRRAAVAEAAVAAGANVVNDVSGGTFDQEMLPVVARAGVPLVMMHMR